HCGLWHQIHHRRWPAEFHLRRGRLSRGDREETIMALSHFNAALLFSIFASVVFGITVRDKPRDQVRYGLYCFAMFMGGLLVAGWVVLGLGHLSVRVFCLVSLVHLANSCAPPLGLLTP